MSERTRGMTDGMHVLSFETATYFGGVGYLGPGGVEESRGPFESRAASREVLAAADGLLASHGCAREDLDLVAISTGPGLFTGVRVGMAIAKTLVWSQGSKGRAALVGVPTLEAVASLAVAREGEGPAAGDRIAAITDARRGEVYAALFEVAMGENPENRDARELHRLGEDIVVRPDRLVERLIPESPDDAAPDAPLWIIGDGATRYESLLRERLGERARILSPEGTDLPLVLARLGRARYAGGETSPPEALHPHYVRRPDARPPVLPTVADTER
ncbi:tRNA (adenosine(37)-N6)-threonylcarbamoyltransferase complex dimerization subunit type 1 TsaB [Candidatus Sumerlaeota bacterium]|nr:tRNA (adenosine(37)-N6)-threonylcarbamoyltransferase complex dimerization subunit type 1 TsaB [Candidatus Sumerlaeota bacterium]